MSRKAVSFKAPPGTRDVLSPESERRIEFARLFARTAAQFGYVPLETPVFEDVGVFQRIGEGTDVVRKEMYEFTDRGDRRLALRPEGTAPVCRAFAQHRPPTPWKVWYQAPMFRYERSQAARYRQHTQVGVEVLGSEDPDVDVEVMALGHTVLSRVGLTRVLLLINTMGTPDTRRAYSDALQDHLRAHVAELAHEDHENVETHPLRVLDSKRPETHTVTRHAPRLVEFLDERGREHFERVQEGLGALGIPFAIEPRLVRGLDYYTHTTFEFQASALDAAQNTVCGGGRYDGLVEDLGGPPTPGMGFGMGIERVLLACDAESTLPVAGQPPLVWVVDVTDGAAARDVTHELRWAGLSTDRSFDARSMRSQMKAADRSGARWAVIIGDKELAEGTVTLRDLRAAAHQETVERSRLAELLRARSGSGG